MASLTLRAVCKTYGLALAVAPTDLDIAHGEFVTLLGPSGCGKSTLLRIICGITAASGGEIVLGGERIEALPPERRDIAMVFQSYALFPHMTVLKNLGFGLRMKRVPAAQQRQRIEHAVEICNLAGLLDRLPRQLSGGQQQRVALARALVMRPALMLFDEPLSNLDAKLRESLRDELVKLHRSADTTSLYVTHDQAEAMAMSDRVLVMNGGRVVESGRPVDLYRRPAHAFTARFLGQTNLLSLALESGVARLPWGERIPIEAVATGAHQATVSIRPEDLDLSPQAGGPGVITAVSFAGPQVNYTVRAADAELRVSRAGSAELLACGQPVALRVMAPLRALQGGDGTADGACA